MKKQIKETVLKHYKDFSKEYNVQKSKETWEEQSKKFRKFWKNKIMSDKVKKLTEEEIIPIVQILDVKGLRKTEEEKKIEGAAFTYMFQPYWYELFREIKENTEIKKLLNSLFRTTSRSKQIIFINEIEKESEIKRLTAENAIILNDFLFVNNPSSNISVLSLSDRFKIINFFGLGDTDKIRNLSYGERLLETRDRIIQLKNKLKIEIDHRGLSYFLYYKPIKILWRQEIIKDKAKRARSRTIVSLPPRTQHPIGQTINFRGMLFAPTEENGVIFLFSKITEDLGIEIISIQKHFPDAKAVKYDEKTGRGYEIFIEFEFLSSDFKRHKHIREMKKGKECDLLVCWEHDWKECPRNIQVIELKEIIKKLPSETG